MSNEFETHDVFNQSPPIDEFDLFSNDTVLSEGVEREGASWAREELREIGTIAGSNDARELGRLANLYTPVLKTHDRFGHRLDVVEYHPAYHDLMRMAFGFGLHSDPWSNPREGAHVARAAKILVWYQVEAGHICPVSMTYAIVPALRHEPNTAAIWEPLIRSRNYDPANLPSSQKSGLTCGMALTEKQGGSDVRSNTTRATPTRADDGSYLLTGHKWFCSAPMSDAFLMLAQAPGGLSCFWVPRWQADGTRNPIHIERLKDKLGDRSNASSEIEMLDVSAQLVGGEGNGIRTIIEMINHTRLDCAIGSAAIMRQGVTEAIWHTGHRAAFGKPLIEQPAMTDVLADLAIESEAATMSVLRLARCYDEGETSESEKLLQRLLTPAIKYWTCKRAPQHASEALECLGGNGFVEESTMARVFRQSPVNGIWEGAGDVICLDVVRALTRSPDTLEALWSEVSCAKGQIASFDRSLRDLKLLLEPEHIQTQELISCAREVSERIALIVQASLLIRYSPNEIAEVFCASRLDGSGNGIFGTFWRKNTTDMHATARRIIQRHAPWYE